MIQQINLKSFSVIMVIPCKSLHDITSRGSGLTWNLLLLYHTHINEPAITFLLNVIYHPLYSMNTFVTNKSKLPQDGAQVVPYMG